VVVVAIIGPVPYPPRTNYVLVVVVGNIVVVVVVVIIMQLLCSVPSGNFELFLTIAYPYPSIVAAIVSFPVSSRIIGLSTG
jgi:hypothetical protein